ncbi:aromatic aminotransferase [Ilyonectria robusta]
MFPLERIPPELLVAICQQLCPHCTPPWTAPLSRLDPCWQHRRQELSPPRLSALANLSLSCRWLRNFARPFLYHFPVTRGPQTLALLKTLSSRPDLASHVKELGSVTNFWSVGELDLDAMAFLNQLADKFVHGPDQPVLKRLSYVDRSGIDRKFIRKDLKLIQLGLLICLAPNLEFLELALCNEPVPLLRRCRLPRLRHLTLICRYRSSQVSLNSVKNILKSAPNLQTIEACGIGAVAALSEHNNLRTLVLERSVMAQDDFRRTMSTFPKLASFTFKTPKFALLENTDATPSQIEQAVMIRRDTLRHFDLAVDPAFCLPISHLIESLNTTALESLSIDSRNIRATRSDDPSSTKFGLLSLLPRKIQSFRLTSCSDHMWDDVFELASKSRVYFPSLRKVEFPGLETKQAVLKQAFRESNIECSF